MLLNSEEIRLEIWKFLFSVFEGSGFESKKV